MKKILAFGTFDLIHPGHISFLQEAKKQGDSLTVVVAKDTNVEKIKKRKPVLPEQHRKKIVENIKMVDKAVLGNKKDLYEIIKKINPDIVVLGPDQKADLSKIREKTKAKIVRIRKVLKKPLCRTRQIIKKIKKM